MLYTCLIYEFVYGKIRPNLLFIHLRTGGGGAAEKDRLSHIMAFGEDPLAKRGPLKPDAKSMEPRSPTPEKDRFDERTFKFSDLFDTLLRSIKKSNLFSALPSAQCSRRSKSVGSS